MVSAAEVFRMIEDGRIERPRPRVRDPEDVLPPRTTVKTMVDPDEDLFGLKGGGKDA